MTVRRPNLHRRVPSLICLATALCLLAPGCVRRRLMIRSDPPGAMAYVDNQPIGTTPCATGFVYYGTREIRLVKPGFETLTVNQPIPAPWYQLPPFDFASENVVPHEIQDFRTVSFNMIPQVIVPPEQLLSRAEQLRQHSQSGLVLPTAPLPAPGSVIAPTGPEMVAPGPLLPPPTGGGLLPPGGQLLEPLPSR